MQKTLTERYTLRSGDCDMDRRMRLDSLFMLMQEGADRHATALGAGHDAMLDRGLFFVLSRMHVQIDRMPLCGETVVHTTWPGASNRFFCPRFHQITLDDGTPLVSASALWAILDTVNRKIASPLKADLGFPDNSDLPAPTSLPNRLPKPGSDAKLTERTPMYTEFDINGHVNNTKYAAWICDALGSDVLRKSFIRDLTVSYEKEIRTETLMTLALSRSGGAFTFQVLSPDGTQHFFASGELDEGGAVDE